MKTFFLRSATILTSSLAGIIFYKGGELVGQGDKELAEIFILFSLTVLMIAIRLIMSIKKEVK